VALRIPAQKLGERHRRVTSQLVYSATHHVHLAGRYRLICGDPAFYLPLRSAVGGARRLRLLELLHMVGDVAARDPTPPGGPRPCRRGAGEPEQMFRAHVSGAPRVSPLLGGVRRAGHTAVGGDITSSQCWLTAGAEKKPITSSASDPVLRRSCGVASASTTTSPALTGRLPSSRSRSPLPLATNCVSSVVSVWRPSRSPGPIAK
jgi:hypothetical protein